MAETIHLTQKIKDILTSMGFGSKEKIALFLGERVFPEDIYVVNTTGPFEGEITSASLDRIFHMSYVVGAIINANRPSRERGSLDRFLIFVCHSHPGTVGEIVNPGYIGWSVDDVHPEYEGSRGKLIQLRDKGNNLVYLMLKRQSDGKDGDDIALEQIANQWRIVDYEFFVRPSSHLAGKHFTGEIDIECYRYDPQMRLGKIRKIPIAENPLTPRELMRTLLNPEKVIVETEKETGNLVLPYRR